MTSEEAVKYLNDLLKLDRFSISRSLLGRSPCNTNLSNSNKIVMHAGDQERGIPIQCSALAILNGLLVETGQSRIVARLDVDEMLIDSFYVDEQELDKDFAFFGKALAVLGTVGILFLFLFFCC